MRLPRMSVRRMMVVIAITALVCAAFFSAQVWCLFAVFPAVGAWRGASRRPLGMGSAVEGGALWGGIQGAIYFVVVVISLFREGLVVLFYGLTGLEFSLIFGVVAGVVTGAGVRVFGVNPGRRNGSGGP
jgi:hypothetical protein